jgi:hypothetical protein
VTITAEVETNMVSVERIKEYQGGIILGLWYVWFPCQTLFFSISYE